MIHRERISWSVCDANVFSFKQNQQQIFTQRRASKEAKEKIQLERRVLCVSVCMCVCVGEHVCLYLNFASMKRHRCYYWYVLSIHIGSKRDREWDRNTHLISRSSIWLFHSYCLQCVQMQCKSAKLTTTHCVIAYIFTAMIVTRWTCKNNISVCHV